jgi:hypothetical protein
MQEKDGLFRITASELDIENALRKVLIDEIVSLSNFNFQDDDMWFVTSIAVFSFHYLNNIGVSKKNVQYIKTSQNA